MAGRKHTPPSMPYTHVIPGTLDMRPSQKRSGRNTTRGPTQRHNYRWTGGVDSATTLASHGWIEDTSFTYTTSSDRKFFVITKAMPNPPATHEIHRAKGNKAQAWITGAAYLKKGNNHLSRSCPAYLMKDGSLWFAVPTTARTINRPHEPVAPIKAAPKPQPTKANGNGKVAGGAPNDPFYYDEADVTHRVTLTNGTQHVRLKDGRELMVKPVLP